MCLYWTKNLLKHYSRQQKQTTFVVIGPLRLKEYLRCLKRIGVVFCAHQKGKIPVSRPGPGITMERLKLSIDFFQDAKNNVSNRLKPK